MLHIPPKYAALPEEYKFTKGSMASLAAKTKYNDELMEACLWLWAEMMHDPQLWEEVTSCWYAGIAYNFEYHGKPVLWYREPITQQ